MNLIRQVRERTSAPIKDVKSSLVSFNWDIEGAQKELRKRGVVLASKKSSRTAAEGLLVVAQTENKAVVVEVNCETDFVARNDIFQYLASSLARTALLAESPTPQIQEAFPLGSEYLENMKITLDHPKLSGETTAQSAITEVAAMVGENVKLRRGFVLSTSSHGVVCSYLHTCPQPEFVCFSQLSALWMVDQLFLRLPGSSKLLGISALYRDVEAHGSIFCKTSATTKHRGRLLRNRSICHLVI